MAGPNAATAADIPDSAPGATSARWAASDAFEAMRAAFATAATRTVISRRSFAIAGLSVRASFAGPALIPAIEPALAHLAAPPPPAAADLEVELWDTASTGVALPTPTRHDRPSDSPANRSLTHVRSSWHMAPRILTVYDADRRTGVIWVPDARTVPSNEVASPMRTLLHWWARDNGLQFVHAGALGHHGRAVLLAGPSGAGKSTSALAGLLSGLDYLGDDYVLVDARAGATVHSLYSAAKLQPDQVAAFPELRPMLINADRLATEKALWFVQRHFPDRTRPSAEAVAILVPRVSGAGASSVTPIPRSTALAALAPSTIVQLPGADQWSMNAMASFLERVPAYQLEAGTDLAGLARTVRGVLTSAATP